MNRFVIVSMVSLLLFGCYYPVCPRCEDNGLKYYDNQVPNTLFRNVAAKYFWEFGIVKITGSGLYVKNDNQDKRIETAVRNDIFCKNYFSLAMHSIAERIYVDSMGVQTFECTIAIKEILEAQRIYPLMISNALRLQNMKVRATDSSYVFLYKGDSLHVSSPELLSRSSVKDSLYSYSFELKKNAAVTSYSVEKTSSHFDGYKPLKLDPAILPLESPGYKKLREQEEALSR